ncbi:MAG: SprT-like domain-containing protein [Deltaproteobacteria bacterium]|nr:SprT-like domain-containing protein [Deltaproteobacteria bacterium]
MKNKPRKISYSKHAKERLQNDLRNRLKSVVHLVITDNSRVFMNAKLKKKIWQIRLHWMFLRAKEEMASHLVNYILYRNKISSKIIDRFIEDRWNWVHHRLPTIRTEGKVCQLQEIFDVLNRRYLNGRVRAQITWGKNASRRSYEQLQMGSFSSSKRLITIHPHLDQKFVPKYVVEATVFHEMCHAVVRTRVVNGRKLIHTKEFSDLEATYPLLGRAKKWEDKNLRRLLKKPR